jgi:hypothetical protein
MDSVKVENFAHEHPESAFPAFRPLSHQEAERIKGLIAVRLGLPPDVSSLDFVRGLSERSKIVPGISAEENFNFRNLLNDLNIEARDKVYINWYRFDDIDEISLVDFSIYFDDIWYPAADAIEVFDESLAWIILIDYSGKIGFIKLNDENLDEE